MPDRPTSIPYVTGRAVRPLVSGLDALGAPSASLLERAAILPEALEDPDSQIPMTAALELLRISATSLEEESIGLRLAMECELRSFDVHFYGMTSSSNLGSAFRRISRYQRLIHETSSVDIVTGTDTTTLTHNIPGEQIPRHSAEFIVASWLRAGRLAIGTRWVPQLVLFRHAPPQDLEQHAHYFGCRVEFHAPHNALVVDNDLLDSPCALADNVLIAVLDRYAADRIAESPVQVAPTLSERASRKLAERLPEGNASAPQLAHDLAMSQRSLSRGLRAEGSSYRELLDSVRMKTAFASLRRDDISIAEVAFVLGFSEVSAFYRAFKRWTGTTPAAFRGDAHKP